MNKTYKIIITILILIALFLSGFKFFHNKYLEAIKALTVIPLLLIPNLIRKIFKINFNKLIEIIIILFLFFAWYLGGLMKFYVTVLNYDKTIHAIFGIFIPLIAIPIMMYFKVYKKQNIWFNIIFFISLTLMIGTIWEIIEFLNDKIFLANDQRIGSGVDDTMYDLICAFIGSIVFSLAYFIEIHFNKKLYIQRYINYLN